MEKWLPARLQVFGVAWVVLLPGSGQDWFMEIE